MEKKQDFASWTWKEACKDAKESIVMIIKAFLFNNTQYRT